MNFINIEFFWLVPFILIFMILLFWRARVRRKTILTTLLGERASDSGHVKVSLPKRLFRFILLLIIVVLLATAVARPFWGTYSVPYESKGRDLMVLFDVSNSMLAEDIKPSRLTHAKWVLRQLVEQNYGDRFGLVAFSGNAFLECPLTSDRTSFMQYIDDLDTSSIPLGGTNLQVALETAMEAFKAAEGNNRAIILISDGDELTGHGLNALKELQVRRIPLFIIGVGGTTTPALIPISRGAGETPVYMRDKNNKLVKTKLNEKLMETLASATGGVYVHSTIADSNLKVIQNRIKKLLPEGYEKGQRSRPLERFYYFLAAATLLAGLWLMLSERGSSKTVKSTSTLIMLVAFIGLSSNATAQNSLPEPGEIPFLKEKQPKPQNLEKLPMKPKSETVEQKAKHETDPVTAYNAGRKLQLAKKQDAGIQYEKAINLAESKPEVRAYSFQNLGVIKHQAGRQEVGKALGMVKQQNLDGALKQLDSSFGELKLAEEMYVKSMSTKLPKKGNDQDKAKSAEKMNKIKDQTAVNQQMLLDDRQKIKKLKKMIEELKKQQQKAKKKTKQAKQQNQKQQQKQQKQNKQKQDKSRQKQNKQKNQQNQKQQQQSQKKDQNKQRQQQNSAQQSLKDARKEVKKLEQQAKQLQQNKLEQNARKADQELQKAQQSQKQQQENAADKHLGKALKYLGANSNKNKQKQDNKKQQQKKNQPGKDKQKQQQKKKNKRGDKKDQPLPKPQPQPVKAQQAPQGKEMDKKQAAVLLKLMAGNEKKLRQALKERQKEMYKSQQVEKNW
ncbi:MAG: VWA domain-containing protein [Lentisphaerae bacterium]|nr:VWA domain-containing protein [Lentisphaerota bacterium]MCP4102800.1 VWA domain-containing protein [Lentisphaerota bacterium]